MKQKSFEQIGQSKDIMDLNWTGIPVAQLSAYPIRYSMQSVSIGNGIVWESAEKSIVCVQFFFMMFYLSWSCCVFLLFVFFGLGTHHAIYSGSWICIIYHLTQ